MNPWHTDLRMYPGPLAAAPPRQFGSQQTGRECRPCSMPGSASLDPASQKPCFPSCRSPEEGTAAGRALTRCSPSDATSLSRAPPGDHICRCYSGFRIPLSSSPHSSKPDGRVCGCPQTPRPRLLSELPQPSHINEIIGLCRHCETLGRVAEEAKLVNSPHPGADRPILAHRSVRSVMFLLRL